MLDNFDYDVGLLGFVIVFDGVLCFWYTRISLLFFIVKGQSLFVLRDAAQNRYAIKVNVESRSASPARPLQRLSQSPQKKKKSILKNIEQRISNTESLRKKMESDLRVLE